MTSPPTFSPLFTDLYEFTMAGSYFDHGLFANATFSLFIREFESQRNFFVAAGLAEVLDELESFHFSNNEIDFLAGTGLFSGEFLKYLLQLRFSGQIVALPEGSIFFPNEPILEITAPIIQAQLVETYLLNTIGLQTLIATKAARTIHAAQGKTLIDFSLRRTHGFDAGNKVARATYIAGFAGTSNVLAGKQYGIPIYGTMAHSYVTAFPSEIEAFRAYSRSYPRQSVFLIDTYDIIKGACNAIRVAKEMQAKGNALIGVRIDSGDMIALSKEIRRLLDQNGLQDVKIFVSSDFDEFKIQHVLKRGAQIDAFGVGTKVGVSADAPYLHIVYKMVRLNKQNVRKLSTGKITLAGKKQVFRKKNDQGQYEEDTIGTRDEKIENAQPLLEKVMKNGQITCPSPSLNTIRENCRQNCLALDDRYKDIDSPAPYPVLLSKEIKEIQPR